MCADEPLFWSAARIDLSQRLWGDGHECAVSYNNGQIADHAQAQDSDTEKVAIAPGKN